MDTELYTSIFRMLLISLVPVTAIVLACSLLGAFLASFFAFRDDVLLYVLRLFGVGIAVVLLWPGISGVVLEESQRVLSYGF